MENFVHKSSFDLLHHGLDNFACCSSIIRSLLDDFQYSFERINSLEILLSERTNRLMATEKTVDELRLENNILLEICESAKKETQANNRDPESIGLLPSPDRNVLEFNCNDQTPLNRKRTIDFISDTESVDSFHTAKRSFIRDQTTGHEKENLSNFKPENDIVFEPKDLCGILRRSLSTSDLDMSDRFDTDRDLKICENVTIRNKRGLSKSSLISMRSLTTFSPMVDPSGSDSHNFIAHRNFLRSSCSQCNEQITFGATYLKCNRCKTNLHEHGFCHEQFLLPCFASFATPRKIVLKKGSRLRLGDYCNDWRPMVPQIISLCSFYLENTQPVNEDIYLLDGDEKEVQSILQLFKPRNRTVPKLDNFHGINIAGSIKTFLQQIREPIIPFSYGKDLINAVMNAKTEEIWLVLENLPIAHMDSIFCICRHLNKIISKTSSHTSELLAEALGPIFFGCFRIDAPQESVITKECSIEALKMLINLPWDTWKHVVPESSLSRSRSIRQTSYFARK